MESALGPNYMFISIWNHPDFNTSCTHLIELVSIWYRGITFPYGIIWDSMWKLIWSSYPLFGISWGSLRSKPISGILYCSLNPLFWSISWRNILIYEMVVYFIQTWVVHWVWWVGGSVLNKDRLFIILWETIMRKKEKTIVWWIRGKYLFSTDLITQCPFIKFMVGNLRTKKLFISHIAKICFKNVSTTSGCIGSKILNEYDVDFIKLYTPHGIKDEIIWRYRKTLCDCIKGEEWKIYIIKEILDCINGIMNLTSMKRKICFYWMIYVL